MNDKHADVLTAAKAAAFLTDLGYPISKITLLRLCRAGKGPLGVIPWGRVHLYSRAALLQWVETRSGRKITDIPVT